MSSIKQFLHLVVGTLALATQVHAAPSFESRSLEVGQIVSLRTSESVLRRSVNYPGMTTTGSVPVNDCIVIVSDLENWYAMRLGDLLYTKILAREGFSALDITKPLSESTLMKSISGTWRTAGWVIGAQNLYMTGIAIGDVSGSPLKELVDAALVQVESEARADGIKLPPLGDVFVGVTLQRHCR